jgi:hypothetical protein
VIKKNISILLIAAFLCCFDLCGMHKRANKQDRYRSLNDRPHIRKEYRYTPTSGKSSAAKIVERKRNENNHFCCELIAAAVPTAVVVGGVMYWFASGDDALRGHYDAQVLTGNYLGIIAGSMVMSLCSFYYCLFGNKKNKPSKKKYV